MNEISAVFLAMGLLAGVIAGFSQDVIAQEFVAAIADFAFSAIVVGLARGILVIASDGMIIDTILNALATGLGGIPAVLFTTLLYAVENLLTILVPSSSGLAALTAPIFGPLTELMGLNPEAAVWALSMGSATMSLICPTSAICSGFGRVQDQAWPVVEDRLEILLGRVAHQYRIRSNLGTYCPVGFMVEME